MKCPKCGYLGFESGDRCRNCGYEFSLSAGASDPMDLPLDMGPDESRPPLDLDRVIGARDEQQIEDLPLFSPSPAEVDDRAAVPRRAALSGAGSIRDDAPLITVPLRPRAPLGVRRATPEVPRLRSEPRAQSFDLAFDLEPAGTEPEPASKERPSTEPEPAAA